MVVEIQEYLKIHKSMLKKSVFLLHCYILWSEFFFIYIGNSEFIQRAGFEIGTYQTYLPIHRSKVNLVEKQEI